MNNKLNSITKPYINVDQYLFSALYGSYLWLWTPYPDSDNENAFYFLHKLTVQLLQTLDLSPASSCVKSGSYLPPKIWVPLSLLLQLQPSNFLSLQFHCDHHTHKISKDNKSNLQTIIAEWSSMPSNSKEKESTQDSHH